MALKTELSSFGFPFDESRLDDVCSFLHDQDIDRLSELAGFPRTKSLCGAEALSVAECAFIDEVAAKVRGFTLRPPPCPRELGIFVPPGQGRFQNHLGQSAPQSNRH